MHRVLSGHGFNVLDYEAAPPWLAAQDAKKMQFGLFSARYGNIYTAAQLRQLFDRAIGNFSPAEEYWEHMGAFYDPYRPSVQHGGFATLDELRADRAAHLEAVKRVLHDAEVFIFTLGLTEAWRSKVDGAVFPMCPGCSVGTFDPSLHEFVNFSLAEILSEMEMFVASLRKTNPRCRVLLTVSPVPLAATYENRNVVESTVYSKSVLRVAAEELRRKFDFVDYFSSYEIITVGSRQGTYFEADQRNVTDAGVAHVTRVFLSSFAGIEVAPVAVQAPRSNAFARLRKMFRRHRDLVCDEEALQEALSRGRPGPHGGTS
jgi:hypothetical protein